MNRRAAFMAVLIIGAMGISGCSQAKTVSENASVTKTPTAQRTSSASTASVAAPGTSAAAAAKPESSSTARTRPKTPAKTGAKLTTLKAPPDKALAMIALPKGFTSARFEATVSPYGWGTAPKGASRQKLLVKVDELKPLDDGAKALTMLKAGSNAVLNLEGRMASSELITKGGKHVITFSVRPEGSVGAFYVEKISPLK